MAIVPIEIATVGRDRGYPIEQLTVYIYCDACGSFNVQYRLSGRMGKGVAVALLCAMGLWQLVKDDATPGTAFICWPAFLLLLLGFVWQHNYYLGHRCRDCGNIEITDSVGSSDLQIVRDPLPTSHIRGHKHYYIR